MSLSSSGSLRQSDLWYGSTMCMIELAMNTNTADSRMGSQSAARKSIGDLFLSSRMEDLVARLSFSGQRVKGRVAIAAQSSGRANTRKNTHKLVSGGEKWRTFRLECSRKPEWPGSRILSARGC